MSSQESLWTLWTCQFCLSSYCHVDQLRFGEGVGTSRSSPPLCLWYREVHGDSELTSSLNEDCKVVRNLRTDIEDSLRLDLLVHGHYREGRTVCARLLRSFGGLMLVEFRSFSLSPVIPKLCDTTHLYYAWKWNKAKCCLPNTDVTPT